MKLLYFAWLKEKTGTALEDIDRPDHVRTVSDLLDWLAGRGPEFEAALSDRDIIKVAVNQEYATPDSAIGDHDEIAIFPPVTGG